MEHKKLAKEGERLWRRLVAILTVEIDRIIAEDPDRLKLLLAPATFILIAPSV